MKRYYMDLKLEGNGVKVSLIAVEEYERHTLWTKYPNAKEMTKDQYEWALSQTQQTKNENNL